MDGGAHGARALRQRLGEVGRLDVAVIGMLDGADEAIGLAERPDLLDLGRRQDVDLDADRLRDAGIVHVLVEAVLRAGEADVADLAEADMLPGLGLQLLVEADGIVVDLADRVAEVEERQQPRRMPGRAGGQLLPLEEHDVGPALLREVVEGRHADHAPADHHHAGC